MADIMEKNWALVIDAKINRKSQVSFQMLVIVNTPAPTQYDHTQLFVIAGYVREGLHFK